MNICFAFNTDGLRCMQPAGHDGPHAHAIEWTDEEAWTPGQIQHPSTLPAPTPHLTAVPSPEPEPADEGCVICTHKERAHTDEGCKGKNSEGDECGCYTFV